LAALAGYIGVPFGNILGPLVIWLIKRDEFPFVDDQGKEALNFQISVTIYGFALAIASVVMILSCILLPVALLLLIAWMVLQLVLIISAAVKASRGEYYRYPITIRFVK